MRPLLPLVLACLPHAVTAEPQYMRVTGVAADDVLNVRADPSAGAADIGDIPPGTGGIEIIDTDAAGAWGRILWEDGNGWLAMRFLEADPQEHVSDTRLPVGLQCSGTEPFWSMRLSGATAVYSDLGDGAATMTLDGARIAMGYRAFPVALQHSGGGAGALSVIQPLDCSDDMSDRAYPYGITVLLELQGRRDFLAGCCFLPLEAGSN